MHQIDRGILQARSPMEIVEAVLLHIRGLISCRAAGIGLYEPDTNEMTILAAEVNGDTAIHPGARIHASEEWMTRMSTEQYHLVEDLDTASGMISPAIRLAAGEGVRSYLSVALVVENNLIGELILARKVPSAFSAENLETAVEVANQLAIAIHQARLREWIESHAAELEERVARRTVELQNINSELQAFTYTVSHDLKAPLRGIDGYSRLLLEYHLDKLDDEGRTFCIPFAAPPSR